MEVYCIQYNIIMYIHITHIYMFHLSAMNSKIPFALDGLVPTRVVPKVMSNFFLHANWEQQTKDSMVVDGTSCCVILECLVMSIACIT